MKQSEFLNLVRELAEQLGYSDHGEMTAYLDPYGVEIILRKYFKFKITKDRKAAIKKKFDKPSKP